MTAIDARQNAYKFYEKELIDILNHINEISSAVEMSVHVGYLPYAIECYLVDNGFVIGKSEGSSHSVIISWDK
jgi:hypothetical protein